MKYFRSAKFEKISRTRRYVEVGDTKMCDLIEFKDISDGDNYLRRDGVNWPSTVKLHHAAINCE